MRVLVTGGAGFIGSAIVERLVAAGHEVCSVDALLPRADGSPRTQPSAPGTSRARLVVGDLADSDVMQRLVAEVDAVCHQAAMVGLGVDHDDVVDYVRHNDLGTATLLQALHRAGFAGRIVLASSMVVYGEGAYRCAEHGLVRPAPRAAERLAASMFEPPCPACGCDLVPEPVDERAATDPRNIYAATKLHQEHLCSIYAREHGSSCIALRYHNVYGPGMPRDTPYAGVAAIFASALRRGDSPRVFEDGGQRRDFIHVRDVARANVMALEAPRVLSGVFNVATGRPRTVLDLAAALAAAAGADAPSPTVVGGARLGDVRHVFASPTRARDVLGFDATIPFEQGVAELWDQ